ncbi:MAG: DUF21 domain-containing protein [Phycisphaerae bacterium]|nr:DUF21 domain-containing protein [Phycisphaerae bacterium]
MTLLIILIVFLVAVFLSGVFSGSETGLYCLRRVRLKVKAEQGDRQARRLEQVLRESQSALSLMLVGTNLMNYLATACFALLLSTQFDFSPHQSEFYTTLIVAFVIFVFGEVVPKNLFQRHPDRLMGAVSLILRVTHVVLCPAVWVLTHLTTRFTAMFGDQAKMQTALDPRKQMAQLLREGMPSSVDDETHHEMVDRTLMLAEMSVHAVMTPRNRVVSIAADARRERLLSVARSHTYSLIPVFGRHPRRIEGIIEIRRLLDDDSWKTVGQRMGAVPRLSPHDSVASALLRLQKERARMAVVVDRGGYLLGIVTLKDLLEELVGELAAW